MKKPLTLVACVALLSSCSVFDEVAVHDIDDATLTATTRIKFHNFSPSSVGVDFYANSAKMTAVSSTRCSPALPGVVAVADTAACRAAGIETTTGTTFGNAGASGLYLNVAPGAATLQAKIGGTQTVVSTVSQTLTEGKFYTFMMSGIYTAGTAEAFVVEDPIPAGAIDYTVAHVRFVNAVSNGTGDLNLIATLQGGTATNIGAAVAYKAAGAYTALPEGLYDLGARYTGSGTNLISRTGLAFVGGRLYTITARGSTATASTLLLDFTSNQR